MLAEFGPKVLRHVDLFLEDDWVFTVWGHHHEDKIQSFLVGDSVFEIACALDAKLIVEWHYLDIRIVHGAFDSPRIRGLWLAIATLDLQSNVEGNRRLNQHR